jgi:hypothetical protein
MNLRYDLILDIINLAILKFYFFQEYVRRIK